MMFLFLFKYLLCVLMNNLVCLIRVLLFLCMVGLNVLIRLIWVFGFMVLFIMSGVLDRVVVLMILVWLRVFVSFEVIVILIG